MLVKLVFDLSMYLTLMQVLCLKEDSMIILLHLPGVPLPLIGMTAYGFVLLLGLKLGGWNLPFKINQSDGRVLLLSVTSSMAAASAYFLYILSAKFSGTSCSYCLASAVLSVSLFFIILKVYPFFFSYQFLSCFDESF